MALSPGSMTASIVIGAALATGFLGTMKTAGGRSAELGAAWKKTNARLGATRDVVKYGALLKDLRAKQAAAGGSSKQLARGIEDVERRYRAAKSELKSYGIAVGDAVREQKRLESQLRRTERARGALAKQERAGRFLRGLRARGVVAAGTAYAAGRAVAPAFGLERQRLHLGSVINAPDRDAAVARGSRGGAAFARRSLATRSELLELEYQLNSASLDEAASRAGSRLAHKLATVTRGESATVAGVLGDVYNNLADGLEGDVGQKMGQIGNVLARTQLKFAISDFGQLGRGMQNAASSAAAYKLPLLDTAAAIGTLNTAAVKGDRAGTALSAVLRSMGKAADELGFDLVRGADGSLDLIATLDQLNEALGDYDIDERAEAIQKIFGDEGRMGLVPLLEQIDLLREGHAQLKRDMGGSLVDDEYRRHLEAASGQLTRMRQNFGDLGETIGTSLLPPLGDAFRFFADGLAAVSGWVEKSPVLGQALAGAAAGFGGLIAVAASAVGVSWLWNSSVVVMARELVSLALGAVPAVIAGIKFLGAAAWGLAKAAIPAVIAGIKLLGAAVVANPIGAAVAAIAVGAVLIVRYWEPISEFFSDLWGEVEEVFGEIDFGKIGRALMAGFAAGIRAAVNAPGDAIRWVLGQARKLLPFSDAREGPFRDLTRSGRATVTTIAAGIRAAGPRPVRHALGAALAGAALAAGPPPGEAAGLSGALLPGVEISIDRPEGQDGDPRPPGAPPSPGPAAISIVFEPGAIVVQAAPGAEGEQLAGEIEERIADALRRLSRRAEDGEFDEAF